MKCGTTTLYDYLAQHPQIATGREKEVGFFSSDANWKRGLGWYDQQFEYDPKRHTYALDASTDYTKLPFCEGVHKRLKASAPRRFKLIYIMRHPLRRIEFHALHAELTKSEMGGQVSRRPTHSFDAGISLAALAFSQYAYQIDEFSEYYDKGQLLLLTLEQLIQNPARVLERVYKFLEISEIEPVDTSVKSNSAASHFLPHPIWYALFRIEFLRSVVRKMLPKMARRYVYDLATHAARPKGRFVLNTNEERVINTILAPDLVRLKHRYNIDVHKEWGIIL